MRAKKISYDSTGISPITSDILQLMQTVVLNDKKRIFAVDDVKRFDRLLNEYVDSYLKPDGCYAVCKYIENEIKENRAFFIIADGKEYVAITPFKSVKSYGLI